MSTTDVVIAQPPLDLRRLLLDGMLTYANGSPRSKQKTPGPSELGTPCVRQLAHKAIQTEPRPSFSDPWFAFEGTCVHVGLDKAFAGKPEFTTFNGSIEIGPAVPGKCGPIKGTPDLLFRDIVIDHKILGNSSLAKIKAHGPGQLYVWQLMLYAFGLIRLGHVVNHVALAAWPRSAASASLHVWTAPYDESIVEAALSRWYQLVEQADALRENPAVMALLPRADGPCHWCSFRTDDPNVSPLDGCPGVGK